MSHTTRQSTSEIGSLEIEARFCFSGLVLSIYFVLFQEIQSNYSNVHYTWYHGIALKISETLSEYIEPKHHLCT